MTHYELLGVPVDADADTIKKAYRKLAMKAHPDIAGDDGTKMRELTEACECLTDPARRSAYDAGADIGHVQMSDEAADLVKHLFAEFIEYQTVVDIVGEIRARLRDGNETLRRGLKREREKRERMLKWAGRVTRTVQGPNIIDDVIESKLKDSAESIRSQEHAKALGLLAIEMLETYVDNGAPADDLAPTLSIAMSEEDET